MLGNPRTWIWITAIAHVVFALVEMTLWKVVAPLSVYNYLEKSAAKAKGLATADVGANMGFYNLILAACLFWLLTATLPAAQSRSLAVLLLTSVSLAGFFGAATIRWTIPIFQSTPALIGLALLLREPAPQGT